MADHHVGQGLLIGVLRLHVADVFALAEDGDAVGDREHLMQLGNGHIVDLLVGVDVKAVPVADLPDLFG